MRNDKVFLSVTNDLQLAPEERFQIAQKIQRQFQKAMVAIVQIVVHIEYLSPSDQDVICQNLHIDVFNRSILRRDLIDSRIPDKTASQLFRGCERLANDFLRHKGLFSFPGFPEKNQHEKPLSIQMLENIIVEHKIGSFYFLAYNLQMVSQYARQILDLYFSIVSLISKIPSSHAQQALIKNWKLDKAIYDRAMLFIEKVDPC